MDVLPWRDIVPSSNPHTWCTLICLPPSLLCHHFQISFFQLVELFNCTGNCLFNRTPPLFFFQTPYQQAGVRVTWSFTNPAQGFVSVGSEPPVSRNSTG